MNTRNTPAEINSTTTSSRNVEISSDFSVVGKKFKDSSEKQTSWTNRSTALLLPTRKTLRTSPNESMPPRLKPVTSETTRNWLTSSRPYGKESNTTGRKSTDVSLPSLQLIQPPPPLQHPLWPELHQSMQNCPSLMGILSSGGSFILCLRPLSPPELLGFLNSIRNASSPIPFFPKMARTSWTMRQRRRISASS